MFGTAEINNEVYQNGKIILKLNQRLIKKQGLSQEQVNKIKELHVERINIEDQLASAHRVEDIKAIFGYWQDCQYRLQDAWGFPRDANFHHSHRLPHCACPKLDNDERIGTGYFIRVQGCFIHDNN
jgi:hypothetical protein